VKKHWSKAAESIRNRIAETARHAAPLYSAGGVGIPSAANTWLQANEAAVRAGYVYDPPTAPILDELARLEKAGAASVGRFRQQNSVELVEERKALARWRGQEAWRAGPSNEEIAAAERVVRDQEASEAAVEARARQIVADADIERIEKAINTARAKARKELEQKEAR
jgi:hypothetical protein